MALILDTNALSAFVDGDTALQGLISAEPDLALPVVVLGEYLFGIRQSRFRTRYEAWLTTNLPLFLVLAIGLDTASQYAEVQAELKADGSPLPTNDVWIAALARQYRYAVVTRDQHFQTVRGLHVIGW